MTVSTTQAEPTKRPRRRTAVVLAVLFLLMGAGLLWFSYYSQTDRASQAAPTPTTTRSPIVTTIPVFATPSPGATAAAPPTHVVTTFVVQTTYVSPSAPAQDSDVLALVTTVSGLLASVAGIVSAIVSVRRPRAS